MLPSKTTTPEKETKSPIRIGMMSLGCPKTLVDSEVILGKLDGGRYQIVANVDHCDVALLNTCSFIRDAQRESVDRILELVELKKQKKVKAVVVMGCMVQEFPEELKKELKEVDAFIGSGEYQKIPQIVESVTGGKKVFSVGDPGYLYTSKENRVSLTPNYYRYIKISEGCDHICSFCTIPSFRGKHRSRTLEDVVLEAGKLAKQGAKELILTGQDTSFFGKDYSGKFLLPELLKGLQTVGGVEWIRVLYLYPSCVTDEMIQAMATLSKVCHYVDMPLQHASDSMLTAMRRGITKRRTIDLIHKFRQAIPDMSLRTTFIVGFPGETEKDFQELLEFIEEMKFERLGIFQYSNEEKAYASSLPNQISEKIKKQRFDAAMKLQQKISSEVLKRWLGKTIKVLIEDKGKKPGEWVGRSEMDAPEIDGRVLIHAAKPLSVGDFFQVEITDTQEYDLIAKTL